MNNYLQSRDSLEKFGQFFKFILVLFVWKNKTANTLEFVKIAV